jgi:hypothetical protein
MLTNLQKEKLRGLYRATQRRVDSQAAGTQGRMPKEECRMENGRRRQPQGEKAFGMGRKREGVFYSAAFGSMPSTCFSVMAAG